MKKKEKEKEKRMVEEKEKEKEKEKRMVEEKEKEKQKEKEKVATMRSQSFSKDTRVSCTHHHWNCKIIVHKTAHAEDTDRS